MEPAVANAEQADVWNGAEGWRWAADADRHDAAVAAYHPLLLEAAAIRETDVVLDVGCGCGQTTIDAARLAARGHAHGVDLSEPMLARARSRAKEAGLSNVTFERADAQVHEFARSFDVVISRNGAMFFADMEAAWRNIGGAVRGGGRLALMGWSPERSEWREAMIDAVAMGRDMPEPQPGAPGPFGLADRDRTKAWLRAGGFDDIRIETRALPFFAGRDTNDALEYMSQVPFVAGTLASLDGAARAEAIERLRATMEAHETSDGVLFDSEALFVTATKR